MYLTDLLHYVAENAIPPDVFGFAPYIFEPKDYSIKPEFSFLSGSLAVVPSTTTFMRISYKR